MLSDIEISTEELRATLDADEWQLRLKELAASSSPTEVLRIVDGIEQLLSKEAATVGTVALGMAYQIGRLVARVQSEPERNRLLVALMVYSSMTVRNTRKLMP